MPNRPRLCDFFFLFGTSAKALLSIGEEVMIMSAARLLATLFAIVLIATGSLSSAFADDASAIQAVVTADQNAQGITSRGVFRLFILIEKAPYAYAAMALGTQGDGSMNYALSKTSGSWTILIRGGGLLGASEMVDSGIPFADAKNLEGLRCPGKPLSEGPDFGAGASYQLARNGVRVVRSQVDARLYKSVLVRGPSVLPRKFVVVPYHGRRIGVSIVTPLDSYRCIL
jgi:hypothetical protein